ncbi:hypothetical protein AGABI1DRAFT_115869, partial [Agaricus bisporus var. burnettii JB137-S8]
MHIQQNGAEESQHRTSPSQHRQQYEPAQPAPCQSPPRPPVSQSHSPQVSNGSNTRQNHVNGRGDGPYSKGQLTIRRYEFKAQPQPSPVATQPSPSPAGANNGEAHEIGSGSGFTQVSRNPQKAKTTNGALKRNAHSLPQSPQPATPGDYFPRKRKRIDGGDSEGEEESEEEDADGGISVGIKGV